MQHAKKEVTRFFDPTTSGLAILTRLQYAGHPVSIRHSEYSQEQLIRRAYGLPSSSGKLPSIYVVTGDNALLRLRRELNEAKSSKLPEQTICIVSLGAKPTSFSFGDFSTNNIYSAFPDSLASHLTLTYTGKANQRLDDLRTFFRSAGITSSALPNHGKQGLAHDHNPHASEELTPFVASIANIAQQRAGGKLSSSLLQYLVVDYLANTVLNPAAASDDPPLELPTDLTISAQELQQKREQAVNTLRGFEAQAKGTPKLLDHLIEQGLAAMQQPTRPASSATLFGTTPPKVVVEEIPQKEVQPGQEGPDDIGIAHEEVSSIVR